MRLPRPRNQRERVVLVASAAGSAACLVTFLSLRLVLLVGNGQSGVDTWLKDLREQYASPAVEILEHLAALPGTRKAGMLMVLAVGAWALLRHRDLRPGLLLAAAFTGTTSTVALLKIVLASPMDTIGGEEPRAFLSAHAANAAALFGMLVVICYLSRRREVLLLAVGAAGGGVVASVGMSVIAGGHHWLTDVLSGFAVAGVWVFALLPIAYFLWRRPELAARLRFDRPSAIGVRADSPEGVHAGERQPSHVRAGPVRDGSRPGPA